MRLATIALASLSLVACLSLPGLAKSKGPCTCQDIPAIEERLKTIDETRAAWQEVLTDMFRNPDNAPQTPEEARQRFLHEMGWDSGPTTRAGGINPRTGDIQSDPVWESQNCDAIVEANLVHERSHVSDYRLRVPLLVIFGAPAKTLAMSEIDARNNEERYLKDQLEKIKQNCQYKCTINGTAFKTLPDCIAHCPDRRTLGHLNICSKQ